MSLAHFEWVWLTFYEDWIASDFMA